MNKLLLQSPTMKRLIQLAAFICSIFTVVPTMADTVATLYTVTVPVESYSAAERARATREGLAQLIVRLTGDSKSVHQPWVADVLENAQSYVLQFGYTSLPATAQDTESPAVNISFSEPDVNRLMRRTQLPLWPANRPRVLVWLVTDTPLEGRHFLSRDTFGTAYQTLERDFARRAVPLQLSLFDLQDQVSLSPDDAWNFNSAAILQSGQRYDADLILVLRFFETSAGNWRGAWLLEGGGPASLETIRANGLDELLTSTVDMVIDRIAPRYTYVPREDSETVNLIIEGIGSYSAYSEVTKVFADLEIVRQVRVAGASGNRLFLSLAIEGDAGVLQQAIQQDPRLVPNRESGALDNRDQVLIWREPSRPGG